MPAVGAACPEENAMPVLHIHLSRGQHQAASVGELLLACSHLFAEVLEAPLDRVRVFACEYDPAQVCQGGQLVSAGAPPAPYFSFVVLQGRSLEERQRLLAGFTDLIVEHLGVERSRVRGSVQTIAPDDWAIGGQPASRLRQAEISARAVGNTAPK